MTQKLSKATILQNTIDHIQVISEKKTEDEKQLERLHREVKGMKIMLNELGGMIKKQRAVPSYQSYHRFETISSSLQINDFFFVLVRTMSNWRVSRTFATSSLSLLIKRWMWNRLVHYHVTCLSGRVSTYQGLYWYVKVQFLAFIVRICCWKYFHKTILSLGVAQVYKRK